MIKHHYRWRETKQKVTLTQSINTEISLVVNSYASFNNLIKAIFVQCIGNFEAKMVSSKSLLSESTMNSKIPQTIVSTSFPISDITLLTENHRLKFRGMPTVQEKKDLKKKYFSAFVLRMFQIA